MRKIIISLLIIVMLGAVLYPNLSMFISEGDRETVESVGIAEPEKGEDKLDAAKQEGPSGSVVPTDEENRIPYPPDDHSPSYDNPYYVDTEEMLRDDGTVDPEAFGKWRGAIQRYNDAISNPDPEHDSRFVLTSPTGIVFTYPQDWPRVMYLENYSVIAALFEDSNENGLWNTNEPGVPGAPVHVYWGPGTTREILPPPRTSINPNSFGVFTTNWNVTETQQGPYRLNFTFNGMTTPNGTAFYEHNPGSPVPTGHWLARESSTWPPKPQDDFRAEIWHRIDIDAQIDSPAIDNIYVENEIEVSGQLRDRDLGWGLSNKVLHLKFDGQYISPRTVTTSPTGTFSFNWRVPSVIRPGPHRLTVEYQSSYKDPDTGEKINYYYLDNATTLHFDVHRDTDFILGKSRVVYRTDTINITGSIVDNLGQGPEMVIGNNTFMYEIVIEWGDKNDVYYEPDLIVKGNDILPSGNFSKKFRIKESQPLTLVHVTFHFRLAADSPDSPMYYGEATGDMFYTVKARTFIELHVTDEKGKDELDYVTRTGPRSEFKISGVLWDKDLKDANGHRTNPIDRMTIEVWWGSKKQGKFGTDQLGRFSVAMELGIADPIGPVVVRAKLNDTTWYMGFDTDSYDNAGDYQGKIIDVVAETTIEIESGVGIKGEYARIKGRLFDDRGRGYGIPNRTIELYWKKTKFAPLGSSIGEARTDATGNFEFTHFQIPQTQAVGEAFVVGIFRGSEKKIHSKDGQKHYAHEDAYSYTESEDIQFNVSAYVNVSIDPSILDGSTYTRGDTIKISGEVVEMFANKTSKPKWFVKDVKVSAFFMWGGGTQKLPDTITDEYGQYEIVSTVPKSLDPGRYTLKMYFNETDKYKTRPEYQDDRDIIILADTKIKLVKVPDDVTGDDIPDIGYTKSEEVQSGYRFSIWLLEKNTLLNEDIPVPNGSVSLKITLWDDKGGRYENTTVRKTNKNGRLDFNFTGFESDEGVDIREEGLGAMGKAEIEFRGSDFLTSSKQEVELNYMAKPIIPPPPPIWERTPFIVGMIIVFCLLVGGMIALILYMRKRARIRGIKRIIKRAADQLVAGNEYTAVIFKSYQKLGYHLRRYGYLRREAETFREFEGAVRTALPVDKNSLDQFLTILEEARYSSHEIGERQRDAAVTNLRNIEGSLSYVEINEEEAMKKLEESEEDFVETEIIVDED